MKIGYLTQTLDTKTGGGRFAYDIVKGVESYGNEVVVLTEENSDSDLANHTVLKRGMGMFTNLREVRSLLCDCDVIHALDGYPYAVIAYLANRTLKKKLIVSALGTYAVAPLYRWQTSLLLKKAYESAERVLPISNFTLQEILKKVALTNTTVITPGITVPKVITPKTVDNSFILGVGGIKKRKGYHIALSAFAKIAHEFPNLQYVIVADPFPPFQAILDKIVADNSLEGRVTFLSYISDEKIQELYETATLFALTPINDDGHHIEGFGLVYLEAARAGLPVIGTMGTGAEDAISEGNNGFLVPQDDVEKTADAMRTILSNQELREKMSRASVEWAQKNSSEEENKKILKVYTDK